MRTKKLIPPGSIVRVRIDGVALHGIAVELLRTNWRVRLLDHPAGMTTSWRVPSTHLTVVPPDKVPDAIWVALAAWRMRV